jgi:hypothetical protein
VLNARARRSEYRLAVSRDLLVHPFVTRTFAHRAPEQTATA